jgi:hypothetical protein
MCRTYKEMKEGEKKEEKMALNCKRKKAEKRIKM